MAQVINKRSKVLVSLRKSFETAVLLLHTEALKMLEDRVVNENLSTFPDEKTSKTYQDTLQLLEQVRSSPQCVNASVEMKKQIEGIIAMVNQMAKGYGLREKNNDKYTALPKKVLERCELFARSAAVLAVPKAGARNEQIMTKTFVDKEAVQHSFW